VGKSGVAESSAPPQTGSRLCSLHVLHACAWVHVEVAAVQESPHVTITSTELPAHANLFVSSEESNGQIYFPSRGNMKVGSVSVLQHHPCATTIYTTNVHRRATMSERVASNSFLHRYLYIHCVSTETRLLHLIERPYRTTGLINSALLSVFNNALTLWQR